MINDTLFIWLFTLFGMITGYILGRAIEGLIHDFKLKKARKK